MPRAKQRTPDLKDRILGAALTTLDRDGVAAFTTRRIARQADTSTAGIYELFGDRAGLVRAMFIEGFERLAAELRAVAGDNDPRAGLVASLAAYRRFCAANPVLFEVMFSRPFVDFAPGPSELAAGLECRTLIVGWVERCIAQGVLAGDRVDIALVLTSAARGLAAQEAAGLLGSSREARDRRWRLAVDATLRGLAPVRPHVPG